MDVDYKSFDSFTTILLLFSAHLWFWSYIRYIFDIIDIQILMWITWEGGLHKWRMLDPNSDLQIQDPCARWVLVSIDTGYKLLSFKLQTFSSVCCFLPPHGTKELPDSKSVHYMTGLAFLRFPTKNDRPVPQCHIIHQVFDFEFLITR